MDPRFIYAVQRPHTLIRWLRPPTHILCGFVFVGIFLVFLFVCYEFIEYLLVYGNSLIVGFSHLILAIMSETVPDHQLCFLS